MAKVTYTPDSDELPKETSQFSYDFAAGKAVDVSHPAHLRKFAGNPHFKVSGDVPTENDVVRTSAERDSALLGTGSQETVTGQANAGPRVDPVPDQPQRGPDKVTPGQADKPDGDSDLRAVHRGKGSYSVVRGDKGQEVVGGLTKEQAEEFNQLDARKKIEFVDANAK